MARVKPSTRAVEKKKAAKLHVIAERFAAFRPAREVLQVVSAVPTVFPQFDREG